MIAELKAGGVAVIFISHRLNEVEHCADRVVVLRDGAVVGELARGEIDHDAMIRMMIASSRRKAPAMSPVARPSREAQTATEIPIRSEMRAPNSTRE